MTRAQDAVSDWIEESEGDPVPVFVVGDMNIDSKFHDDIDAKAQASRSQGDMV